MNQPIIFAIDDDPQVISALSRDLKNKFRDDYRVMSTASAEDALRTLLELKNRGEVVALFVSDQRMPEMEGIELLVKTMAYFPDAKRVLLTAYADTDAAIKAINEVKLDFYLSKPWDPPEEKLYPVLVDLLDDWQGRHRPDVRGIKVIGYQFSPQSHAIKEFLSGYLVPYSWLEAGTEESRSVIEINNLNAKELPAILFEDGTLLKKPAIGEIATKIGLQQSAKNEVYDVVVVGAGPAGLAASVYGSSEGLKTLLIERKAPGGQAGTSSRIENYLGFPAGLSGADLTRRAIAQTARFGTDFLTPRSVKAIKVKDNYKIVVLENDEEIVTKTVVITTGVDYRQLTTKGIADFSGAGVYYGAAMTEATSCKDRQVFVVGGGNSAGQSAMYLSKFARNVYLLIRKSDLRATMSAYLIDQIAGVPNIKIMANAEIAEASGELCLQQLVINDLITGKQTTVEADALYIFIGAKPYTDWLGKDIIKNEKGFLETGRSLMQRPEFDRVWKIVRDPYFLETSCPGIFAAGDVREGAMNRVASAVGEGSMAISFVHQYLSEV